MILATTNSKVRTKSFVFGCMCSNHLGIFSAMLCVSYKDIWFAFFCRLYFCLFFVEGKKIGRFVDVGLVQLKLMEKVMND